MASVIIPRKEGEKLKGHSRLNKVALFLCCAVIVLSVFYFASIHGSGTIQVHRASGWGFHTGHWRLDGADTFHDEFYVLHVGPLEFYHTYNVSDGPLEDIQTIAIEKQRKVEIFAQQININVRRSTLLLYCFWESQNSKKPIYGFGTLDGTTNGLQFDLISSQDGKLVGVTERSWPNVVLIVHDFSSGFDWPGSPSRGPAFWKTDEKTAEFLIAQLAKDNQLRNLVLGGSSRSKGIAVLQKHNDNE
jgi:hypothetical protein